MAGCGEARYVYLIDGEIKTLWLVSASIYGHGEKTIARSPDKRSGFARNDN